MGFPADFIDPVTGCMSPTMTWPPLTDPGLPNFLKGVFAANFAGISYVLDFIPPTPEKVAGLSPPSIALFSAAFLSAVSLPSSYPSVTLGPLTIPGVGSPPYERPADAQIKFMAMAIVLPFQLITTMVTGLLSLSITLPTPAGIEAILATLATDAGLSGDSIGQFGGCAGQAITDLFSSLIPV